MYKNKVLKLLKFDHKKANFCFFYHFDLLHSCFLDIQGDSVSHNVKDNIFFNGHVQTFLGFHIPHILL